MGSIRAEVIRPNMIRALWPSSHAGTVIQPQPSQLGLFLRNLETLLPPDARDPFVVHTPALGPKKLADSAIPPAPVQAGQFHHAGGEPLLIAPAPELVALRRAGLPHDTTGPTL